MMRCVRRKLKHSMLIDFGLSLVQQDSSQPVSNLGESDKMPIYTDGHTPRWPGLGHCPRSL